MIVTSAFESAAWPEPARRLAVGLAFSVLAHAAAITVVRPKAVDFLPSRPLQVDIIDVARSTDPGYLVAARSDFRSAAKPLPEIAENQTPPAQPRNIEAVPVSGLNLGFAPERYYTSRELDARAEPLNDVPLVYPKLAYQNRRNGMVVLRILINERGVIDEVAVVESEPRGLFEQAALDATRALKFSPAIRNGRPVKSQKTVEVAFNPYDSIHLP